jgi:hypothetical protein
MVQSRGGSDVCEHEFACIKSGNPNPNLEQCVARTSGMQGFRAATTGFSVSKKTNSSQLDAIYFDEVNMPLRKKDKF